MAYKHVTVEIDGNRLYGVQSVQFDGQRQVSPVHYDTHYYNEAAAWGGWAYSGSISGVDKEAIQDLEATRASNMTIRMHKSDGGGADTYISIAGGPDSDDAGIAFHGYSEEVPEPGSPHTGTIQFVIWAGTNASGVATPPVTIEED